MIPTEVRGSWRRALRAGVDPDNPRWPANVDGGALRATRARSGLQGAWPMMLGELAAVTRMDGHLVFLSDNTGRLLWNAGRGTARAAAERANLVPGACWHEDTVGTNGVGTVLTLGRPYQVRGREHFLRAVGDFTCSAAPIRDHVNGRVLGVLDVTAPAGSANALTLTVVTQAARLAEAQLQRMQLDRDLQMLDRFSDRIAWHAGRRVALVGADGRVLRAAPAGWLGSLGIPVVSGEQYAPDGQLVEVEPLGPEGPYVVVGLPSQQPALSVRIRDRERATVAIGDRQHTLSVRHTAYVRALLAHPVGLSAADLAEYVYGDPAKVSTVRGEITRLRRILGNRLQAAPYRIAGRIDTT
ncbi:GAF domain-containing protein [Nocardioidaceae bacterium SCSIO 66511]|nr:GAF domain-containing protein [Nocardioidaceae bacterium SCSIO 66511]